MEKFPMPKMYGAVTVGERGQVVIPAKIRKLFQIKTGEKLIVFAKPGGPIGFIPAGQFTHFLEHATEMLTKLKKGSTQ
jgi:AbrB family looped-hinge helix DNA binding protein